MAGPTAQPAFTLNHAIAAYQAGRLADAEEICRRLVAANARSFDALHILAVAQAAQGKHALALTHYDRAIALNARHADALSNRGNTLKDLGRFADALASYERAIAVNPTHAGAHSNRAVVLQVLGRQTEALAACDRALALQPNHVEAQFNRGNVLFALKRYDEALASYARVLAQLPNLAMALVSHGNTLRALGRHAEALAGYDRAIAAQPGYADAHDNRATALYEMKRYDEALASCDRALALRPDYPEALNNRGVILHALLRYEEALECYARALALRPNDAEALYNRGNALRELKRDAEALASYDAVLAVRPEDAEAWNNRGQVLKELDRWDEAVASCARALALKPDSITAHCNMAALALLTGDLARGFAEYEWRWKRESKAPALRHFAQPLWLGDGDIAGRTILLHSEQGFGDTIQFCRYLPQVVAGGARVILEVEKPLARLMATLAGSFELVVKGTPLPAFDVQCPLPSLPLACGTVRDTIPAAVPYLAASADAVAAWQSQLGPKTRPRIGLAWSGNPVHERDKERSSGLAALLPLLAAPADFISLHKDVRPEDMALLRADGRIRFVGDLLGDYADTAALIAGLDLVVSVDTSVAHLAGALAKPVWVMVTHVPDWRWLLGRDDSPWYPTLRLFRQDAARDWAGVVARVEAALGEFIAGA